MQHLSGQIRQKIGNIHLKYIIRASLETNTSLTIEQLREPDWALDEEAGNINLKTSMGYMSALSNYLWDYDGTFCGLEITDTISLRLFGGGVVPVSQNPTLVSQCFKQKTPLSWEA